MKLLLSLVFFLLNGCSASTANSIADIYVKNKVENSIRKSAVERYTNEEVWRLGATQVGYVESNYCQVDFRDLKPSTKALISELEVETQKLGGNALVYDSCIKSRTATCQSYTQCRGMAYIITYNSI